jgi:hypothetical protein
VLSTSAPSGRRILRRRIANSRHPTVDDLSTASTARTCAREVTEALLHSQMELSQAPNNRSQKSCSPQWCYISISTRGRRARSPHSLGAPESCDRPETSSIARN